MIERLSVELSQRCSKACWFCYAKSTPAGATRWSADDVVTLVRDCAANGLRAVSFGGGEPLETPLLWPVLEQLRGVLFRSLTTNGLPLEDPSTFARLSAAKPDKVHLSIHFPDRRAEVDRVIASVRALSARGIKSGVNLLVQRSKLQAAARTACRLQLAGIGNDRIVDLPMRGTDTPSPAEVARVARAPFQSMSCLRGCASSPRFCAIAWDRTVGWCSYTTTRAPLAEPTHAALMRALDGLGLTTCEQGQRTISAQRVSAPRAV